MIWSDSDFWSPALRVRAPSAERAFLFAHEMRVGRLDFEHGGAGEIEQSVMDSIIGLRK